MNGPNRSLNLGEQEEIDVPRCDDGTSPIDGGTTQSTPAQEAQDEFDDPGENAAINDPVESQSQQREDNHVPTP
jgi:hypothetical protein